MNKIYPILMMLLFLSCGKETESLKNKKFDFDEVIHYHIAISQTELFKESVSKHDRILQNIMTQNKPFGLSDTTFFRSLEAMPFVKRKLDPKLFGFLKIIFKEKSDADMSYKTCIPMYRDILLFKNSGKLVGLAKICFDCHQSYILGVSSTFKKFGQDEDYNLLNTLLNI